MAAIEQTVSRSMSTRVRQSNMELLRIIAMAMIVMVHTDFWSLGELIADICAYEPSKALSLIHI